jgi:3-deoxy-manno-octulosonate cytidylyltransferase (CMP-KDO synthetase)
MRTIIIIPARYASTRFPGKPLAALRGHDGTARTLIERSWLAARGVAGIDRVVIATDDMRIADAAQAFGADVAMTPASCRNGTERCAATLDVLGETPDLVINLQGDAPLTPASFVTAIRERMMAEPDLAMCTPAVACSPSMLAALVEDQAQGRVGGTTVVFDRNHEALYFSKRVIPYVAPERIAREAGSVYLHLGVYAYRPAALASYLALPPSPLEDLEGLEQLRFLEAGIRIGLAVCPQPEWEVIELNNPTDVPAIEAILAERGWQ